MLNPCSADREPLSPCETVVQQGIDKAAADTAACDAKFTTITSEHIAKTEAWQSTADRRLDSAEIRLDEAEASLKTKATLEETKDLREKVCEAPMTHDVHLFVVRADDPVDHLLGFVSAQVALCALRTEMRELLEGLRQETSSRVRILKERLDRTDRELLRQLEEYDAACTREQNEKPGPFLVLTCPAAILPRYVSQLPEQ